jgi:hypothetical protein
VKSPSSRANAAATFDSMKTLTLMLCTLAACVGDSITNDGGVDAATTNDATTDASTTDAKATDAALDAGLEAEAEPPCVTWDAAVLVPDPSGVQCGADGSASYCFKDLSECCADSKGVLSCVSKQAGCGTEKAFPCDKASDCDGGVCCVRNPVVSNVCANRVWSDDGTYCAVGCPASDITVCNAGETFCGSPKQCVELELVQAPGKILSGCR